MSLAADILLGVLLVVACYTDIRTQKIKNILTFPVMLAGLVLGPFHLPHWYDAPLGFAAAFVIAVPGWWWLKAMRAGDVKMLLAAGTLLGPEAAMRAALFTFALNIPYGLIVLALRGRLKRLITFYQKQGEGMDPTVVAYAPVVAAGVLLARLQPWPDLW